MNREDEPRTEPAEAAGEEAAANEEAVIDQADVAESDAVPAAASDDGMGEAHDEPGPLVDGDSEGVTVNLEELVRERDQIRDQHLRLAADFDNYRKRTEGDLRIRWDRAQAELVGKLLEPLDDLQRVAAWEPETTSVDAIVEGVDLVERKFLRVIEEIGVEILSPVGERFDPNTMEAMMRVPTDSPDQDDIVEQVFQKGCTLKGHLVRPARVSVFKAE